MESYTYFKVTLESVKFTFQLSRQPVVDCLIGSIMTTKLDHVLKDTPKGVFLIVHNQLHALVSGSEFVITRL